MEKIFTVNPYDCILKVVSVVKVDTVSKVEIAFSDRQYEMEIEQGRFWLNGQDIGSADFYELYTELMSIFIEKELPKEGGGSTGNEGGTLLMTVAYHRSTPEAPAITQRYYAYDRDYAAAEVNGTRFFLVSRVALRQLEEKLEEACH